ncbi:MAG: hypothetical protein WCA32_06880 [Chromatiaceae bacterium]
MTTSNMRGLRLLGQAPLRHVRHLAVRMSSARGTPRDETANAPGLDGDESEIARASPVGMRTIAVSRSAVAWIALVALTALAAQIQSSVESHGLLRSKLPEIGARAVHGRAAPTGESVSLTGDVPLRDFPNIQEKADEIWSYLVRKLRLGSDVAAPYIYFHSFDKRTQSRQWTTWQKEWTRLHPQIWRDWTKLTRKGTRVEITKEWIDSNIDEIFPFPVSFLAFHYDGTNRIQINPSRTFGASVQNDPYGLRRDLNGQGYYSLSHEMLHYALEAKGIGPTRLHHCLFIHTAAGDDSKPVMEDLADHLLDKRVISITAKLMGLRSERYFDPCRSLTEAEMSRVEEMVSAVRHPPASTIAGGTIQGRSGRTTWVLR